MNADPKHGKGQLARAGESDYHAVLLRVIQSTTKDPAQLRNLVYELARIKLRRETWLQDPPLNRDEANEHLRALEAAIADVEAITAQDDTGPIRPASSTDLMPLGIDRRPDGEITIIDPPADQRFRQFERIALVSDGAPPSRLWTISARFLQLAGIAVLGVVIYVVVAGRTDLIDQVFGRRTEAKVKEDRLPVQVRMPEAKLPVVPPPPAFPLPSTYGVYALNGGQLHQLELLSMRAPDERVLIGPILTKPSQTILADGKVTFIIFRRDLVSNAPERVSIRVVARIARAWPAGKPAVEVDSSWTIRGKAYEFRVAPMGEDQQMIMIKPENEDFTLPAGRYVLALKGQAYDFTVEGPVTDPAQCLERIEAVNGTVYSPCKP